MRQIRVAVFKNAGLGLLFQFLIRLKGIITLPIIVHFLSKEDLGSWLIISTSASLILPIITLNLFDGSGMFFSSDFDNESVTRKYSTILSSVSLIVLVLIVPVAFILYYLSITKSFWLPIIIYLLISIVFKAAIMLFQCYQKSKLLVFVNFIVAYGSTLLTMLVIIKYRSYLSIVVPIYVVQLVVSIILFARIYKEIKFKSYIDKFFLRKVLKIGIPLIPVYITEWLLSSIGVYMLGYFGQLAEVGSFSVLLSISGIFLILRTTLQFFWFSTCSNLLRGEKIAEFNSIYQLIVKGYIYLIISGIIFYTFFVNDLIKYLASKEYLHLATPIIITVIGNAFLIFSSIYNGILYAVARTKEILLSYLVSSLTVVIISLLLIPQYRILGAALSMVIGNFVLQLMLQLFSKRVKVVKKIDGLFLVLFISFLIIILSYYVSHLKMSFLLIRTLGVVILALYTIFIVQLKFLPLQKAYDYIKYKIIRT